MTLENTIHEYVCDLAEEAMEQIDIEYPECVAAIEAKRKWMNNEIEYFDIKIESNGHIKWVSEREAVKDCVIAACKVDPVEALKETLAAHSWVMTREAAKEFGGHQIKNLLMDDKYVSRDELLNRASLCWDSEEKTTQRIQNEKLVKMILGDSNG